MILAKASIVNYNRNHSFIVLAMVITIVNYDRKTFIVQATTACLMIMIITKILVRLRLRL